MARRYGKLPTDLLKGNDPVELGINRAVMLAGMAADKK